MNRKKQCVYIHMGTTDTKIYNWVGAHQSTKWFFIYHSSLEWTWNSESLLVLRRGVNTRQNGEKRLRVGDRTNYERNPNQPSTKNLVGELLESLWLLNDWHKHLYMFLNANIPTIAHANFISPYGCWGYLLMFNNDEQYCLFLLAR